MRYFLASSSTGKLPKMVRGTILNETVEDALNVSYQYSINRPWEISFREVGNQNEIRLRNIYTARETGGSCTNLLTLNIYIYIYIYISMWKYENLRSRTYYVKAVMWSSKYFLASSKQFCRGNNIANISKNSCLVLKISIRFLRVVIWSSKYLL
jgi:hypothetical protein